MTSSSVAGSSPLTSTSVDFDHNYIPQGQSNSSEAGLRLVQETNGTEKDHRHADLNGKKNGKGYDVLEGKRCGKFKLNFEAFKVMKQKLFPKRIFNRSFIEGTIQDRFNSQDKTTLFSLVR
jgi:hypothetical protein